MMKAIAISFHFIILNSLFSYGQTYFSKTYDQDKVWQFSGQMALLKDGSIFIEGDSERDSNFINGVLLIRIDINGNELWRSYFEYSNYGISIKSVSEVSSKGIFYSAGLRQSISTALSDIIYIKHNKHGDTVWVKELDIENEAAYGIEVLNENNIYITGPISDASIEPNIFLSKFDSSGNQQWIKYYGGVGDDRGFRILNIKNHLYISGYTNSPSNEQHYDTYLSKVKHDGTQVWENTYGNNGDDGGFSGFSKDGKGYIVGVSSLDTVFFDTSTIETRYVTKLDTNGKMLWRRFFARGYLLEIWNLTVTPEDEILICGYEVPKKNYGWLVKLSSEGDIIWERRYQTRKELHPAIEHYITDVEVLDNGDIVCLGTAPSISDTTRYDRDIWVLRVDSNGCLEPGCDVGIEAPGTYNKGLVIYPNPARNHTTLMLERPLETNTEVLIYNSTGQKIRTSLARAGMIDIPLETQHLSQGLYMIQLVENGVVTGRGKLMKMN